MSENKPATESRRDVWQRIEAKHFGQCVWQQRLPNGKVMLEGLLHKATGRIFVAEVHYEAKMPRPHSGKEWPDVEAVYVYAPVDAENMTWDGLDAALASFKPKEQAVDVG